MRTQMASKRKGGRQKKNIAKDNFKRQQPVKQGDEDVKTVFINMLSYTFPSIFSM